MLDYPDASASDMTLIDERVHPPQVQPWLLAVRSRFSDVTKAETIKTRERVKNNSRLIFRVIAHQKLHHEREVR